jgi:hypothetical protein
MVTRECAAALGTLLLMADSAGEAPADGRQRLGTKEVERLHAECKRNNEMCLRVDEIHGPCGV